MASGASDLPGRIVAKRQRVVGTRRIYNQWVNNQTLEDYALRYTARKARRWSPLWVANTALGSIAFLACEAIGATVTAAYGFHSTVLALLTAGVIFLISGLPVCYYGARYNVDMDLLTRGSGFGYLGSTITSAVYASFTFILFALEAVILSAALKLCFGIPLPIAHLISALIVIPISAYGFARISKWQNWTQPIWLILQCAPLLYFVGKGQEGLDLWTGYAGTSPAPPSLRFGLALAVFLSLLPQIGEQVDYLRFLPDMEKVGKRRWWTALLLTGPGWIVPGAIKILFGSFLAVMALGAGMGVGDASNPTMLYYMSFGALLHSPMAALMLTGLFVAICQIKINVTNAYAGSIASSNFFSRLTHRHPGRAVWLVFNVLIALMLMQGGIQNVVERVLALYSNFAVAWFGAVIADLMVSKPLGLSPKGIEFRRAYLHDINPVGVGAMVLSLLLSTASFSGMLGEAARAVSPIIGLATAFIAAPLLSWATGGRYYLARPVDAFTPGEHRCVLCENSFEPSDMARCPVYQGNICSLCCTLEARCHDACKPPQNWTGQLAQAMRRVMPSALSDISCLRIIRFLGAYGLAAAIISVVLAVTFYQSVGQGSDGQTVARILWTVLGGMLIVGIFPTWYLVLSRESQRAAEEESDRQTSMLVDEIEAHARTDAELQRARKAADAANLAKSRFIVGISHEIRTPLNTISGYAQLLNKDPAHLADAVRVISRSATHLTGLIDGLIDVSRIENGSVRIQRAPVNLHDLLEQLGDMFRLQAATRGIQFSHNRAPHLPQWVYSDEKRLRQILINLISNAIKYTPQGSASLAVHWRNPVAEFEIKDTGVGIAADDMKRIFEPFERINTVRGQPGVGLGLTITRLLADIMGGQVTVESQPGAGSVFRVKMFFSEAPGTGRKAESAAVAQGNAGITRTILVADDDPGHLDLVRGILSPLGCRLLFAQDGAECLRLYREHRPNLILLDIAMPQMNGWEVARTIRGQEQDEEVSILMVSANVHDFQRPRHVDDPHDDYLFKPYDVEEMRERVLTLIGPVATTDGMQPS